MKISKLETFIDTNDIFFEFLKQKFTN